MQLYIIRHGQSTNNAGMPRVVDPLLTPLGEEQALFAANALRDAELTHLYASPMRRAMQTAAAIAEVSGLPLRIAPDYCEAGGLREPPGLTRPEILTLYPTADLHEAITETGWWPGAEETMEAAAERARCTAENLRAQHESHARVALVTHGTFGSFLIHALLGLTPELSEEEHSPRFSLCNTGMVLLDFALSGLYIHYQNRTDHLPPEKVTGCYDV